MVFGPVFEKGRRAVIDAAEQIGGRILEVGVGTGISLPEYSPDNQIVGIDISEMMLRKARERVAELELTNVEHLSVMDAANLEFAELLPSTWWSRNWWSPPRRTRKVRLTNSPAC